MPSDPELRERLKDSAADENGKQALFQQLVTIDPDTAARLHPNDVARVSRAVEVYLLTGKPLSQQQNPVQERPFTFCLIGTTLERSELYRRIEKRVDAMMALGLLGEVRALLASGVPPEAQAMQGIGYKELVPVVLDHTPLAEAVTLLKQNTRHYAKRQWTWFNAEKRFQWLDMARENSTDQALRIGEAFWKEAKE